jgi:alpha-2-macroglobulin
MIRIAFMSFVFIWTLLAPSFGGAQSPTDYATLKSDAEKLYAEGSYAQANALYAQAANLALSPSDLRWVKFCLADSRWRALAATQNTDHKAYEPPGRELEALVRDVYRVEDRDVVWAEVEESLGDLWWTREHAGDWERASPYYKNALEWWVNSSDIETARTRYLGIVTKWVSPVASGGYYLGENQDFPVEVLEKALRIARSPDETAFLHYAMAKCLRRRDDEASLLRVSEFFEAALAVGKNSEWHDDALYSYGEWEALGGRIIRSGDDVRREPRNC